jgi:hypothetical protein
MEVHHHPDLHHKKKNFKEYFLEFIMIFLAVTLGFIAENLRERIHNRNETADNILSMVADLKSDSAMFSSILAANEYSVRMTDTLIDMLGNKSSNTGHIYFLARNITAVADWIKPDTRTFEQMKTTGSFQLIKSKTVLDSITAYYQSLKWFDFGNNLETQRVDEVINSNGTLFNGNVFKKMLSFGFGNAEHNTLKFIEPDGNPPLMTDDASLINIVIVRYQYFEIVIRENNGTTALEIERCNRLIKLLNKEYSLN